MLFWTEPEYLLAALVWVLALGVGLRQLLVWRRRCKARGLAIRKVSIALSVWMLLAFVTSLEIGFAAFAALIALGGCATPPEDPAARAEFEADNDPIEPINRAIFDFNLVVDGTIIKPAALVYRGVLPEEARTGIHNALQNLRSPIVFANDVLQGETQRAAGHAFLRLIERPVRQRHRIGARTPFGVDGNRQHVVAVLHVEDAHLVDLQIGRAHV